METEKEFGRYQESAEGSLDADGGPFLPDEQEIPGLRADHGGEDRVERVGRRRRRLGRQSTALAGAGPGRGRRAPPETPFATALVPRRLLGRLQGHQRLDPLPRRPHRRSAPRNAKRNCLLPLFDRSFRLVVWGHSALGCGGRRSRGETGRDKIEGDATSGVVGVVEEVAVVLFGHDGGEEQTNRSSFV